MGAGGNGISIDSRIDGVGRMIGGVSRHARVHIRYGPGLLNNALEIKGLITG